jgi:indolepyruvate ferredoxin oxidoreductase, beta subunit
MASAKTWNVLMVGVGGQGIVTSSDILTRAAMEAGHDAKKSEIHGMSQRGGSVFSHIRFGPSVSSPVIPEGGADILFSLEELETLRWLGYAGASSTVICAGAQILPVGLESYPSGVLEEIRRVCPSLVVLDVKAIEERIGNPRFMNVALLGVLSRLLDIDDDSWKRAILAEVPPAHGEANWQAFLAARELAPEAA